MKSFKTLISEIFDVENIESKELSPSEEKDIPGFSFSRTYKTNINGDEVMTKIDHSYVSNKSDVKFFVNGHMERYRPKRLKDAIEIYKTVLSHIKHHIENPPEEIKAIKYSYNDDEEGQKKHKIYQKFGKKFDIPLEARVTD